MSFDFKLFSSASEYLNKHKSRLFGPIGFVPDIYSLIQSDKFVPGNQTLLSAKYRVRIEQASTTYSNEVITELDISKENPLSNTIAFIIFEALKNSYDSMLDRYLFYSNTINYESYMFLSWYLDDKYLSLTMADNGAGQNAFSTRNKIIANELIPALYHGGKRQGLRMSHLKLSEAGQSKKALSLIRYSSGSSLFLHLDRQIIS